MFFVAREPMYATICSEIKSVKSAIVMIKMKHVCKHNYLTIISNLNKKNLDVVLSSFHSLLRQIINQ